MVGYLSFSGTMMFVSNAACSRTLYPCNCYIFCYILAATLSFVVSGFHR